jgi:hypothetical protein
LSNPVTVRIRTDPLMPLMTRPTREYGLSSAASRSAVHDLSPHFTTAEEASNGR